MLEDRGIMKLLWLYDLLSMRLPFFLYLRALVFDISYYSNRSDFEKTYNSNKIDITSLS